MNSWTAGGWRAGNRSTALMYGTGGLLAVLSMVPTPPPQVNRAGILAVGALAMVFALVVVALGRRFTLHMSHFASVAGSALVALAVAFAGGTSLSAAYGLFLVWVAQYAAVFYRRRGAMRHVGIAAAAHAIALWSVPAGQRLILWAVTTGACYVVLISYSLVDRYSGRLRGLVEQLRGRGGHHHARGDGEVSGRHGLAPSRVPPRRDRRDATR